ncbi:3-phenylpropionate/trans-cinnamate dioxygenase ferredoxin reductase subunit [Aurantimicrobium minutum]|uniref:NAD(P)/FAD-dependent oxidoreductase n=1 Tax=Aurantimicrobium minutum TaxID=708131 RepID=UPI0024764B34|nr:FAD-dependent oxidoreductase [Aurantimicrobium minutum]MDH6277250.1 3-phenylpropionate/trans-cinnamate dioxygenase ferredoxin reductase subunit [Aurantimicrobium minutum]
MSEHILIIGGGQAGMQIAVTLREEGFDGSVTIVGEEHHGPYQRPPLSKAYLAGEADAETLELRNPQFYVDNNIVVIPSEKVVSLAWGEKHGVATTETGRELPFDKLALATGSDPKRLTCEGADLDGVLYMRGLDDANELKARWEKIHNIVVIGGGFIGLEVAAVARKYNKHVTVVHSRDRLMSRAVGPVVSEFFLEAHIKRGAEVLLDSKVTKLHGESGTVSGVELADGTVIPADAVMVGIGVSPRGELATQLGLEVSDNGAIVVDSHARTSDPRVVACGDVALLPHPLTGENMVMLESVQNAVDQAKLAAKSLLGGSEEYHAVPWFWSDQAELKLQMAGLSQGFDQQVVRGNPDEDKFSVLYYKNGRIIAVDAVNDVLDYMAVRRALTAGQNIPADLAADSSVALKTLVTD